MCWNMPTSNWSCEDQEQVDKVLQVADRLPGLRRIVVIETKGLRSMPSPSARASLPSRRSRKASGARTSNRGAGCGAGWPAPGRYRADDLHLGLDRQAQGRDAELPQYARRGLGHRRAAGRWTRAACTCLSAAVPRGRADAVHLRADLRGFAGEFWRIHPHRAGRPARGRALDLPGRAAHLGKTARGDFHQDAGSRTPAAMAVPAGADGLRAVPGKVVGAIQLARTLDPCVVVLAGAARLAELHRPAARCGWR